MRSILIGDIGGTNARFGIAHRDRAGHIIIESFVKRPGDDFPTLRNAIEDYLSLIQDRPTAISLAVAGPIHKGQVTFTNRNWHISETEMCDISGIASAKLFNDFAAMARSIPEMSPQDFELVHDGQAKAGAPILVAGPGTGFGVGYVIPVRDSWVILNTEGGHIAYAPRNGIEAEILSILQQDFDFVSVELVTSGSGLERVHRAVCQRHDKIFESLSPAAIREKAQAGDLICQEICDIRSAATMGAIGDLALSGGARGGIVLAGGVSERMIDSFKTPQAMARFFNRGPRSDYVKDISIRLLNNPMAPLIGAAALYLDQKNT